MIRKRPRILIAVFGALAGLTTFVALSWACTPSAYISVGPGSESAGSTVTVTGKGFIAQPVEISWNGGGVLATAAGPNFSTSVKIPNAAPGIYYVRAIARDTDGTVIGNATRAFELTAKAPASATPQPGATEPPARATSDREQPASKGEGGRPARRASPAARAMPAVTTRSSARVLESPVARATRSKRSGQRTSKARRRAPSARSAVGDHWRGFSDGARSATLSGPSVTAPTPRSELLIPGVALLAFGLMALAGGLGVGAMRRRRRAAASQTR